MKKIGFTLLLALCLVFLPLFSPAARAAELDEIRRKILQLEIEETVLKKEEDKLAAEHLQEIQKELSELREQFRAMKAKWENEKSAIGKVQKLREEIEETQKEIKQAERDYDLSKLAELRYGKLEPLKKQLEAEEHAAEQSPERKHHKGCQTYDSFSCHGVVPNVAG